VLNDLLSMGRLPCFRAFNALPNATLADFGKLLTVSRLSPNQMSGFNGVEMYYI